MSPLRTSPTHARIFLATIPRLSKIAAWLAIFCCTVCCQSCFFKGNEALSWSRNRSFCVVFPQRGSMSPTGKRLLSQVIIAQLFSRRASSNPCVIVICEWSSTTTPISSIGIVRSAAFLKVSGNVSLFDTSGKRNTNWALRKLRYEGFPKYNVRLIMIFPLFHPKLRYAPYEDLIPITTLYSPFLVFPSA